MAEFDPLPPQPLPVKYALTRAVAGDGTQLVRLIFSTPQGQTVLFFDGLAAEQFGMQLANEGRKAKLTVAPAGALHTTNGDGPV